MQLPGQGEYIGQIRSWHSTIRNLSTTNRFQHIEREELVVPTPHSSKGAFVIFVQMLHSENTTPHEA